MAGIPPAFQVRLGLYGFAEENEHDRALRAQIWDLMAPVAGRTIDLMIDKSEKVTPLYAQTLNKNREDIKRLQRWRRSATS